MKLKVTKEYDLIEELQKIADIPGNSGGRDCHKDHREMTERLEDLIKIVKGAKKK